MISKTGFTYIGSNKKEALADCYHSGTKKPTVIFCHGFKSFKDWGHFSLLAKEIATSGFTVILFNYTHNGTDVNHPKDFVDLEAFAQNNLEKELYDLNSLISSLPKSVISSFVKTEDISLLGHSRGGGIALSYTLTHTEIKKCITLASVIDLVSRYGNIGDEKWKEEGVKYIKNGRTNQDMPLYYQLALNTTKNKSLFDFPHLIKRDHRNFLLLHGTDDNAVDINETNSIVNLKNVNLIKIEGANHTFGGTHPYESSSLPKHSLRALMHIRAFLLS